MRIVTYKCDRCGRESKKEADIKRLALSFPYARQAPDVEALEEDFCDDCIRDILQYARKQKEEPEQMKPEPIEEEKELIEEETHEEMPEEPEEAEPELIETEEAAPEEPEERAEAAPEKKKRVRIDKEEMWRLYMAHVSIYDITKRLGCKKSTVHTILSRMKKERFQSKEEE